MQHHRGKSYVDALQRYDRQALYTPAEGIDLVRALSRARFDETVELAIRLGIDARRTEQRVRGAVSLPAGSGKRVRVAVFATGEAAAEAIEAGADQVGSDDLVERIRAGDIDWDVTVATPDLMSLVGRVGRELGTRKLMPNPRLGTVTADVGRAVRELRAGRVKLESDRTGNVHAAFGKVSFSRDDLLVNFHAILEEVHRLRPAAAKGRYLRSLTVSSSMGPGVRLDPMRLGGD